MVGWLGWSAQFSTFFSSFSPGWAAWRLDFSHFCLWLAASQPTKLLLASFATRLLFVQWKPILQLPKSLMQWQDNLSATKSIKVVSPWNLRCWWETNPGCHHCKVLWRCLRLKWQCYQTKHTWVAFNLNGRKHIIPSILRISINTTIFFIKIIIWFQLECRQCMVRWHPWEMRAIASL